MSKKNKNIILDMVTKGNHYLRVPEGLDAMLGVEKANILVRLLYRFQFCILKGSTDNGYFYYLQDEMFHRTKISKKRQTAFIEELERLDLITIKKQRSFYAPKMFTFTANNLKNIKDMGEKGRAMIDKTKNDKPSNTFIEKILSEIPLDS